MPNRLILIGEGSLRQAVRQFLAHYHQERNHQGLGNVLIFPTSVQARRVGEADDPIACRERLGGLLKFYHRPARDRVAEEVECSPSIDPRSSCGRNSRFWNGFMPPTRRVPR